jgi:hypothetical protein
MNIIAWMAGHQSQLIALLIAIFCVGTAKKWIPKMRHKERGSHARWASFIIYIIGGLALAWAMVPFIYWVIRLGGGAGLNGLVGNFTAIVTFALGWHSVAMIVSMIRDLADKQPDHEARSAALWVPTLAPIGITSVFALLQNPQGVGQGITAAIMGVITLIYAGMIVKRCDDAQQHKNKWNWFAFAVLVLAGIVIIPLVAYVDTALIGQLPSVVRTIVRVALGLSGLSLIGAGIADIWIDRSPDVHARNGARIGIALVFVFGGIGWQAMVGATADGASFLNGVF